MTDYGKLKNSLTKIDASVEQNQLANINLLDDLTC